MTAKEGEMQEATWGYCGFCRCWFYGPDWAERGQPLLRCPGCGLEPVAVEGRGARRARPSQRRARGRCLFCAEWFDCDGWDEPAASVPCCPRCAAPPGEIAPETDRSARSLPTRQEGHR